MARLPPMIQTTVRRAGLSQKRMLTFSYINPIQLSDLTDFYGFGKEKRRNGNLEILAGRETFRCCTLFRSLMIYQT
jgi:hypothetical protein